jgi:IstB-like ATP binding protein
LVALWLAIWTLACFPTSMAIDAVHSYVGLERGSVSPRKVSSGGPALSADGNAAIVGGAFDNPDPSGSAIGAAWVFTRSNGVWTQQGTLVTTNRPFAEWREVFPTAACVASLIDRLVHHAEIIAIDGESYRLVRQKRRAAFLRSWFLPFHN